MLIGFLPFVVDSLHLFMAAIAWGGWSSYVQGVEFSVIDALVLAIYLTLPDSPRPLPFRISMALYFVSVLASAIQAEVMEVVFFYCWHLARMFLVYATVTRACADLRVVPAILKGMGAGLLMEAGIVLWQRFGLGMLQTPGNLGHQNLVGMVSFFVTFPFFALLLSGRGGWLPPVATLAGCVAQVLTVSRATVAIAGIVYLIMFTVSALQQWTSRKTLIALIGAAGLVMLTPSILSSIEQRGRTNDIENSDKSRTTLLDEAWRIISDYPLGVGANQYVNTAQKEGYRTPSLEWGVMVHNVYLLILAETGYFGLFTFLAFLLSPLAVALRCGWRFKGEASGALLLGVGMALLAVYIQGLFEFEFLEIVPQYLFALELGMVAGMARELGYWGRPFPGGARLATLIKTKSISDVGQENLDQLGRSRQPKSGTGRPFSR
jgi:O-antigen ligase